MRTAAMLAATVSTGLMAGLYFAFSCAVMLGLRHSDDRTFVVAMQKINVAILNGWFVVVFVGALIAGGLSVVLEWRADDHSALRWVIAGVALYLTSLIVTVVLNVPLNDRLQGAGLPADPSELAAIRSAFEAQWNTWNIVRTVATGTGFASLSWALVLLGRATAGS